MNAVNTQKTRASGSKHVVIRRRLASGVRLATHSLHVLVVDDEPCITRSFVGLFAGRARVSTASSSGEAMQILEAGGVDVVLSDCDLGPGDSGVLLLHEVRLRWPHVRRLLMSGCTPNVGDLVGAGLIERFFAKPVKPDDLVKSVIDGIPLASD